MAGTNTPAGSTDILISYVYKLAFEGSHGQDFGVCFGNFNSNIWYYSDI